MLQTPDWLEQLPETLTGLMGSLGVTLTTVWDALPYLLVGGLVTMATVAGAMGLGLIMGVPMSLAQTYGPRWLRFLASVYVWFFRGTPILVLLFLVHFGLFGGLLGIDLPAIVAAALVLGMTSTAYQSQIFRGAIQSLPQGQFKAARSLGMSTRQALQSIILPQALRISIPGWSNEYSIILKDSALAFALGAPEIMARTHFVATRTYTYLPLYITAGVVYLIITIIGLKALRVLERKVHIPGYM